MNPTAVGIIINEGKDADLQTAASVVRALSGYGVIAVIKPAHAARLCGAGDVRGSEQPAAETDVELIIVIGGDGTLLRAARHIARYKKPLLGVNKGRLGFLTAVEANEVERAIECIIGGEYTVEERMMIRADFSASASAVALNDITVTRSGGALARLCVYINGKIAFGYGADGLIISTPTGSTAYNLSAGGPILPPMAQMLALTPICPHALYARPIVISAADVVRVESDFADVTVCADGRALPHKPPFTVIRSDETVSLMRVGDTDFYDILRRKMNYG